MRDTRRPFALFRVAAGPRLGFGHLRRATVLAGLLERPCALSIRGAAAVRGPWRAAPATPAAALEGLRPRLLVIDDPHAGHARVWLRAARRAGVPCASVHDLGLAPVASDLAVDGSLVRPSSRSWPASAVLEGPAFAVLGLDGAGRARSRAVSRRPLRIVLSLGGGVHARRLLAFARALRAALPDARLVVPAGLHGAATLSAQVPGLGVIPAPDGLGPVLVSADLAVLAGGVTLYEAAALGVPVVAVPVVAAQRPTVRAFVRHRLAVTVPPARDLIELARLVAQRARRLGADVDLRRTMRARGPALIDGRGAERVARAFVHLAEAGHA